MGAEFWARVIAAAVPYRWRLVLGAVLVVGLATGWLVPAVVWFFGQLEAGVGAVVGPAVERIGHVAGG